MCDRQGRTAVLEQVRDGRSGRGGVRIEQGKKFLEGAAHTALGKVPGCAGRGQLIRDGRLLFKVL